jgi:hypothetical protein
VLTAVRTAGIPKWQRTKVDTFLASETGSPEFFFPNKRYVSDLPQGLDLESQRNAIERKTHWTRACAISRDVRLSSTELTLGGRKKTQAARLSSYRRTWNRKVRDSCPFDNRGKNQHLAARAGQNGVWGNRDSREGRRSSAAKGG